MTEGSGQNWGRPGDEYGDQQREQSFPPPPPAPTWDRPAATPPPYGQAPAYDQGPAYGQDQPPQQWAPQAPPYQEQAYGQTPWGNPPPGYGGAPAVQYASWGARAVALILDGIFSFLLFIPGLAVIIGATAAAETEDEISGPLVALGVLLLLAAVVVLFWNQGWRQGSVGWSWGKQVMKIKLVRATDARPPGGWIGIGRLLLRSVLGNVTFGVYTVLTYLWPLWDERKQSLDDKMLGTLVVKA